MTEWLPVPDYEELYTVSGQGEVWSIRRQVKTKAGAYRMAGGKMLSRSLVGGYYTVILSKDGKAKNHTVHSLVARAFHGERPTPTAQVRHRNGIKTDVRASNLVWGTASENCYDRIKHGHHAQARKTHCPSNHAYAEHGVVKEVLDKRTGRTWNTRVCTVCKRDHSRTQQQLRTSRKKETPPL